MTGQPKDIECIVCRSPIIYHREQRMMTCHMCGRIFMSNAECSKGHYVCDRCHSKTGVGTIMEGCLGSDSKDPISIAIMLMSSPDIHMHGPEHHVLIGSALLTAYSNCVDGFDLSSALKEMENRGRNVPGSVCGLWGTCGAAISCGMAYSIITGTTPLSEESWGKCMMLTSRCLERISSLGGPRCCKRDGFTALLTAAEYIDEELGIRLDIPDDVVCTFHERNMQCLKERCPFHIEP